MSSRQSRAMKRSLAISTSSSGGGGGGGGGASTGTSSTARSSTADHSPAAAAANNTNGDRGPLSSMLSDDDGPPTGRGGGGRRGLLADDDSIVSLSFRSHSTTSRTAPLTTVVPTDGGGAAGGMGISSSTLGASSAGQQQQQQQQQQLDPSDPRLHLAALNDERSTFGAVSRSCLALNQWAGGGVGGTIDDGGMDLCGGSGGGGSNAAAAPTANASATTSTAGPSVCSSLLLCPSDHPTVTMPTLRSLISCCTTHTDRRCRISALRTLALVARSVYARTREGEMGINTFAQRDGGTSARVEDEVVNDVAVTMLSVGMEEDDDGVSAAAFEAAGMLVLSSSLITPGAAALEGRFDGGYDALSAEIASIVTSDPSWRGTADPSWMSTGGGNGSGASSLSASSPNATAIHELSSRVYSSIVPPRIRRILHRIRLYRPTPPFAATSGTSHVERTLPFVTGALSYMLKTERSSSLGLDKAGYAKRWTEMDSRGMAGEAMDAIILPVLSDGWSYGTDGSGAGGAGKTAALAALRLVHVCPAAEWAEDVCRSVVGTMADSIRSAAAGEGLVDASTFATMMVALRGMQPSERAEALSLSIDAAIKMLPATEAAPATVGSAGLSLSDKTVRRPVRLGLFTEAALLVLMPNPGDGDDDTDESIESRSDLVFALFGSPIIQSVLTLRSDKKRRKKKGKGSNDKAHILHEDGVAGKRGDLFSATSVADEMVLVFCSVASVVGRRLLGQFYSNDNADTKIEEAGGIAHFETWLRASLALLYELSSCMSWRDPASRAAEEGRGGKKRDGHGASAPQSQKCMTVSTAARGSYLKLLSQCLAATDLIDASSSVTANMVCFSANGELDEGFGRLAACAPLRDDTFALGTLSDLMDWMVETKLREGVSHRGVRISLLSLLSDYWVQVCRLTMQSQEGMNGASALGLNEMNAREILSMLASEISMLIEEQERVPSSPSGSTSGKEAMHNLFVCVACIENMALAANDFSRRYGNRSSMATSEDSSYIVSVSTAILNGQGKNDEDRGISPEMFADPESPASIRRGMIEECVYAARRIQGAAEADHAYANGGGYYGQAKASMYCSPLIERERSAFAVSSNKGSTRCMDHSSIFSLTLESGGHFSTPLGPYSGKDDDSNGAELPQRGIGDIFDHGYMFQHYRQAILLRTDLAIRSAQIESPNASNMGGFSRPLRPCEPLRLSIPPPSTSDAHKFSPALPILDGPRWIKSSADVSGTSDPVAIRTYFADRLCPRYDGEVERRLAIVIKMHNVTAVPIPGGIRMDLTVEPNNDAIDLNDGQEDAPSGTINPLNPAPVAFTTTAFHRQEITAGDHITWTIETHGWAAGGAILQANVSFRDLEAESTTLHRVKQSELSAKASRSDAAEDNEGNADDDFSDGQGSSTGFLESEAGEEGDETVDLFLCGEPLSIPSSIVLQPCSLVFFRDAAGDEVSFRFLWSSMPHCVPAIMVALSSSASRTEGREDPSDGYAAREIAGLAKIVSLGNNTEGWAFSSWNSKRILCVLIRDESDTQGTLYVRGDDKALVNSLVGSTRDMFVSDLTGGRFVCLEQHSYR